VSWIRLSSNICFPASNSQLLRGVYSTVELPWNQIVGNTSPLALWSHGMVSLNANDDMVGELHSNIMVLIMKQPVRTFRMMSLSFPRTSFISLMK